jgi:thiosulfate dehydrogenase
MPWVGVHARYPQYRSRSATIQTLADRINDCFKRSLAGKPLPEDDERMHAIQAYFALLSRGVPVGARTYGQGIDSVHLDTPDTLSGRAVFEARCARCHGADGGGTPSYPPVWGEASFTIGAGMGRYRTAAAFIRHNMPFDSAGVLTEREALDVAGFIDSRPRRDLPGKERDWPRGNAPSDVPYRTVSGK